MSRLRIKQISYVGADSESCITFDGDQVVWQKLRHVEEFDVLDLNQDSLTIQHLLGRKFVHVSVYDENDSQIVPDAVVLLDIDSLVIDLSSFIPDLNTAASQNKPWTVVVT